MRDVIVFYAWQDDKERRFNRHLIRIALEMAARTLSAETSLSVNVKIDSDTQGVLGWAPVTPNILEKIDSCDFFVPDVTFVAETPAGKQIPNPNVMFESGYAWHAKTYKAMIPVMNIAYGLPDKLPFDMAHLRFPTSYDIKPGAPNAERRKVRASLALELTEKLRAHIVATQPTPPPPAAFSAMSASDGPARFRAPGDALGLRWDPSPHIGGMRQRVALASGAALWLRVMPVHAQNQVWPVHQLREKAIFGGMLNLMPFSDYNISFLRAEDGMGICSLMEPSAVLTGSVAFAFETGEVWGVDTDILAGYCTNIPFFEKEFADRLLAYVRFLRSLGIEPPFRWEAGLTGIKERHGPIAPGQLQIVGFKGPQCLSDIISAHGTYDGQQSPTQALMPLFKAMFEKCGVPRPPHLPQ
jgi:hypothetical protein